MSKRPDCGRPQRLALRPAEAAAALGVSSRTLRSWMRDEQLPFMRVGGAVLIPVAGLEEWMAARVASRRNAAEIAEEILREL